MADRPGPLRRRGTAFGLLALGALLGLVTSQLTWWQVIAPQPVPVTGDESTASLAAVLAGAVAAGSVLGLLLRRLGVRILAVPLLLLGAGMLALGFSDPRPGEELLSRRLIWLGGPGSVQLVSTHLALAYAAAGVLVCLGAVLVLRYAGDWPQRANRFERRVDRASAVMAADDPGEVWKALDAGADPTLHADGAEPAARPDDTAAKIGDNEPEPHRREEEEA